MASPNGAIAIPAGRLMLVVALSPASIRPEGLRIFNRGSPLDPRQKRRRGALRAANHSDRNPILHLEYVGLRGW